MFDLYWTNFLPHFDVIQSKLGRLPAYLTVQMVRFFYKEKESVNAKVLKVRGRFIIWIIAVEKLDVEL